jgi:hypothetical protein
MRAMSRRSPIQRGVVLQSGDLRLNPARSPAPSSSGERSAEQV